MIYTINKSDIDISKLERVGCVNYNPGGKNYSYILRYSVNGFTWDIEGSCQYLEKIREDLMHSWHLYKLGEGK